MKTKLLRKIRKYYSWKFISQTGGVIVLNDYLQQTCGVLQNVRMAVEYMVERVMDSSSLINKNYNKRDVNKSRRLYFQHKNDL